MTDPRFFSVVEHVELNVNLKGFTYLDRFCGLHVITFTVRDLDNPTSDPIGLFYVAGTRRYIWRDKYWADFDVPVGPLLAAITVKLRDTQDRETAIDLRRIMDVIKCYKSDAGPTDIDTIDNLAGNQRQFSRVIYEVKE